MDIFLIYVWTRLDVLSSVLMLICIFCVLAMLFTTIELRNHDYQMLRRRFFIALLIFLPLFVAVPTSSNAMFILGGSAVLEAAKSDTAKRIAGKSVELIESTIDK